MKIIKLLISALLLVSLVACQNNNDSSTDSTATNDKSANVTLTVAARGGSHAEVIESVKADFEKEHHCTIEVLGLEAADLKQKAALDATNKQGAYDLVMVDDPVMPEFVDGGVLLNLTSIGYKDDTDFVPASAALGKGPYQTGDTYALPFTGNVQLLFYNKSLLDSTGSEVPTSWQQVLSIAQKLKADSKQGYVIRGQQGNPIVGDFLPILWAHGGDIFDADWNVIVNSAEAKQALQLYLDLLATGANYEKDDLISAISNGNGGMALGWPSWFISGDGAAAAYAKIPGQASDAVKENATGMIGNWMMGVTANSKNQDLALDLLKYLTSAEVQKKSVAKGGVPTRISIFTDQEILGQYPYFTTIYEGTNNSVVRPRTPKWSNIEEVFGIELSNVVAGVKDIDSALADAKAAIEKVMQ